MNKGQFRAGTTAGTAGTGSAEKAVERVEFDALAYLQSVYNDPMEPTGMRMRAAAMALGFERPALKAHALVIAGGDFATRLDAAIARSSPTKLIEAKAEKTELPPSGPEPTSMAAPFTMRRA